MSDEKYVGAVAAAKNAMLTKAALDKKLDKTGGTVTGSLEINGDMHAGGAVQSDFLLSAPSASKKRFLFSTTREGSSPTWSPIFRLVKNPWLTPPSLQETAAVRGAFSNTSKVRYETPFLF